MIGRLVLLGFICLLSACVDEPEELSTPIAALTADSIRLSTFENSEDTVIHTIYIKEQLLTRWESGQRAYQQSEECRLSELPLLLPGRFRADMVDGQVRIQFPNPYYESKMATASHDWLAGLPDTIALELDRPSCFSTDSIHHVWIFPEEPNDQGVFAPLPAHRSPHWMAEQYAQLAILWDKLKAD